MKFHINALEEVGSRMMFFEAASGAEDGLVVWALVKPRARQKIAFGRNQAVPDLTVCSDRRKKLFLTLYCFGALAVADAVKEDWRNPVVWPMTSCLMEKDLRDPFETDFCAGAGRSGSLWESLILLPGAFDGSK